MKSMAILSDLRQMNFHLPEKTRGTMFSPSVPAISNFLKIIYSLRAPQGCQRIWLQLQMLRIMPVCESCWPLPSQSKL